MCICTLWQPFHFQAHYYMLNQCKLVSVVIVIGSIMFTFASFCYAFVGTLAIWLLSHLLSLWLWLLILVWLHHTCTSHLCWSKVFPLNDLGFLFRFFFLLIGVAIWLQVITYHHLVELKLHLHFIVLMLLNILSCLGCAYTSWFQGKCTSCSFVFIICFRLLWFCESLWNITQSCLH